MLSVRLTADIGTFTGVRQVSTMLTVLSTAKWLTSWLVIVSRITLFLLEAHPTKNREVITVTTTVSVVNSLPETGHLALRGVEVFSCFIQFFF